MVLVLIFESLFWAQKATHNESYIFIAFTVIEIRYVLSIVELLLVFTVSSIYQRLIKTKRLIFDWNSIILRMNSYSLCLSFFYLINKMWLSLLLDYNDVVLFVHIFFYSNANKTLPSHLSKRTKESNRFMYLFYIENLWILTAFFTFVTQFDWYFC